MRLSTFSLFKKLFISWVILCLSTISNFQIIARETDAPQVFPLVILDDLPSDNRYFYPSWDKCCEVGKGIYGEHVFENSYKIKLPNGFTVTVSDWDSNNNIVDNYFSLVEDTIFIENRDGVKKAIAAGQGWGDPMMTLALDNKSKRIYIRESLGTTHKWGDLITREYDLKCSDTNCAFYKDRDCLLKIKNVDEPSKILKDLAKAAVPIDDFIGNINNLDIVFLPALSGKKENIEFFFDIKKWGKYAHIDDIIHTGTYEIYSANTHFLLEYGRRCFTDSGIDWEKFTNEK